MTSRVEVCMNDKCSKMGRSVECACKAVSYQTLLPLFLDHLNVTCILYFILSRFIDIAMQRMPKQTIS